MREKQLLQKIVAYVTKYAAKREVLVGIHPDTTLGRDILRQNIEVASLRSEVAELKRMVAALTTTTPKQSELGFCVNCRYANIEPQKEPCCSCSDDERLARNFNKADGIPDSRLCDTCRNNLNTGMIIGTGKQGFPCRACANEYFYTRSWAKVIPSGVSP